MTKQESLALFAQGREAWNAWAAKMFAQRATLQSAGTWIEERDESAWNDATRAWHGAAAVVFSMHTFDDNADFSGFTFPGDARFDSARFSGGARFERARFTGGAGFEGGMFSGAARFIDAAFSGDVEFDGATFSGDAQFSAVTFSDDAWFRDATFSDEAWFHRATFSGDAGFDGATFLGRAQFSDATFSGYAGFHGATFSGYAGFHGATFSGYAWFHGATFSGDARFLGATFSGDAWFDSATFSGYLGFGLGIFGGATSFGGARFEKNANFGAIDGKSAFSLAGAVFLAVPDFIQAHFAEAPRLDDIHIQPTPVRPKSWADIKKRFVGDPDLSARWRALKRLAVQGHDHEGELAFFKGEVKARRWCADKPWQATFWFGVLYQWLSDFGRSLIRPLLWWAAGVAGFAWLYLGQHRPLSCVAGPGDPWHAALGLSLRRSLLFVGQDSADKIKQIYGCLYGIYGHPANGAAAGGLPPSFSPVIPDWIAFVGIVQSLFSAVLIFLFLLAVRNHFRIK